MLVEEDYEKALELFEQAEALGVVNASTCLGFMYYYGHGVEQDPDLATQWLNKAADLA